MERVQLHGAVVLDVGGDHDVSTGLVADCQGNGLEAGGGDGAAGEPDCAGSDAAECARGGQVRDSVSGVHSRGVWGAGREFAGAAEGGGGVRLVRDSVVDRGHGDSLHAGGDLAGGGSDGGGALGVLHGILAAEYGGGVARGGVDTAPAGLWRAVHVCDGGGADDLGADEGGELWDDAFDAEPVSYDGGVSDGVFSVADGDCGLLGDAGAEYSGFLALREVAEIAGMGAGFWVADCDDAVYVCGDFGDVGLGGAVWQTDLESDRFDWRVSSAGGGVCGADCDSDCDAEFEYRSQRGFAVE